MDDKTRADFWEAIAEAREESCNKYLQAVREVVVNGIKREDYEASQRRVDELLLQNVENALTNEALQACVKELESQIPDLQKSLAFQISRNDDLEVILTEERRSNYHALLIAEARRRIEAESKIKELKAENAAIRASNADMQAQSKTLEQDAKLGRLVRAMPENGYIGRICDNGEQVRWKYECLWKTHNRDTPEEALRAGGVTVPASEGQETPVETNRLEWGEDIPTDKKERLKAGECYTLYKDGKPYSEIMWSSVCGMRERMLEQSPQRGKEYCPATTDHFCPKADDCIGSVCALSEAVKS